MNNVTIGTALRQKFTTVSDAADLITDGMTIAVSGYSMAGYPKAVLQELVQRKRDGSDSTFKLISGANVPWVDELLSNEKMISMRAPMCSSRTLSRQVNANEVIFKEQQMCKMPHLLQTDKFGHIDVAVIEALGFDNQGCLIPTTSVGMTHYLMNHADSIIIEINHAQPEYLRGLHDIYIPQPYPNRQPIPLVRSNQRIGTESIAFNHRKIIGIVETHISEFQVTSATVSQQAKTMAEHMCAFLETEYASLSGKLPPIQTGFGNIADAVAYALNDSHFHDLEYFCGGVSEPVMHMLANGKVSTVSTGGVVMNEQVDAIMSSIDDLKDRFVLRNGDITNSAEVVSRLAVVAVNTGIEVDIYGNVNSSHISGSAVVNGIGGGADFAHNAGLSIVLIPSTAKDGAISCIVPMVSHQDICEHDVDVVITEHGVADLRALDDVKRAETIIACCTSGVYQKQLYDYLKEAKKHCGGHHPQLPHKAYSWYERLKETKTMVEGGV